MHPEIERDIRQQSESVVASWHREREAISWLSDLGRLCSPDTFFNPKTDFSKFGELIIQTDDHLKTITSQLSWSSIRDHIALCSDGFNPILRADAAAVYETNYSTGALLPAYQIITEILEQKLPEIAANPLNDTAFFRTAYNILIGTKQKAGEHESLFQIIESSWQQALDYQKTRHDDESLDSLVYMWQFAPIQSELPIKHAVSNYIDRNPYCVESLVRRLPVTKLREELAKSLFHGEPQVNVVEVWRRTNTSDSPTQTFLHHYLSAKELKERNYWGVRTLSERDNILQFGCYAVRLLERQINEPIPEDNYVLVIMARGSYNYNLNQIENKFTLSSLEDDIPVRFVEANSVKELEKTPLIKGILDSGRLPVGVIFRGHGLSDSVTFSDNFRLRASELRRDGKSRNFFERLLSQCQVMFLWSCNTALEFENQEPLASVFSDLVPTLIAATTNIDRLEELKPIFYGFGDEKRLLNLRVVPTNKKYRLVCYQKGKRKQYNATI